jgi:hypothetical protein
VKKVACRYTTKVSELCNGILLLRKQVLVKRQNELGGDFFFGFWWLTVG